MRSKHCLNLIAFKVKNHVVYDDGWDRSPKFTLILALIRRNEVGFFGLALDMSEIN